LSRKGSLKIRSNPRPDVLVDRNPYRPFSIIQTDVLEDLSIRVFSLAPGEPDGLALIFVECEGKLEFGPSLLEGRDDDECRAFLSGQSDQKEGSFGQVPAGRGDIVVVERVWRGFRDVG
jgi:hypothetical protein